LFFDFAGYSAFAVGLSYLFGIHTPENFDKPFQARNIRDFWNRWHVSLSAWFRDHVYMRFVLAAAKGRWFRSTRVASQVGSLLAMGLMGLWHGTTWYYVAYGVYHGALLAGHDAFTRWNERSNFWGDGPLWRAASVLVTFHFVAFGFLIFSGRLA
jgi:membrane protein involved in D-alanine export